MKDGSLGEQGWTDQTPVLFTARFSAGKLDKWLRSLPDDTLRYTPWSEDDEEDAYDTHDPERTIVERRPPLPFVEGLIELTWDAARHPQTYFPAIWILRSLMCTVCPETPEQMLAAFCQVLNFTTPPGEWAEQDRHVQDDSGMLMYEWLIQRARQQRSTPLVAVRCQVRTKVAAWVVVTNDRLPEGAETLDLPALTIMEQLDYTRVPMPTSFGHVTVHTSLPEWVKYEPFTDVPRPAGFTAPERTSGITDEVPLADPVFIEESLTIYGALSPADRAAADTFTDQLCRHLEAEGFTLQRMADPDPRTRGWTVSESTPWGVCRAGTLITGPHHTLLHADSRTTASGPHLVQAFEKLRNLTLQAERRLDIN